MARECYDLARRSNAGSEYTLEPAELFAPPTPVLRVPLSLPSATPSPRKIHNGVACRRSGVDTPETMFPNSGFAKIRFPRCRLPAETLRASNFWVCSRRLLPSLVQLFSPVLWS